jgi:hypothetical protein
MIGTEDGYWYSLKSEKVGRFVYVFHRFDKELEFGECEDFELDQLFDEFVTKQRSNGGL